MIFSYSEILNFVPVTVKGKVVDVATGQPVMDAHVFTKRGDEEIFTSSSGEFHFKTWNPYPVSISIEHRLYERKEVLLTTDKKDLLISVASL